MKDNAADWHNLILKWDKLNDEGSTIANKIVNLGISKGYVKVLVSILLRYLCKSIACPS